MDKLKQLEKNIREEIKSCRETKKGVGGRIGSAYYKGKIGAYQDVLNLIKALRNQTVEG